MQISIKTFCEKLRKELSNGKTKSNNWCFVKIIHHRQFLYDKPVIEFINCDRETNFAIFAFALGQKALQSPGFPKCFSEVFLGELIKFFFFFFWNPWPILCSACNQDRSDFPGEMGLKPENKSLLPNFSESLFLKHMTIVTVENLSAWHERGGRHCWKSWSKHNTPS